MFRAANIPSFCLSLKPASRIWTILAFSTLIFSSWAISMSSRRVRKSSAAFSAWIRRCRHLLSSSSTSALWKNYHRSYKTIAFTDGQEANYKTILSSTQHARYPHPPPTPLICNSSELHLFETIRDGPGERGTNRSPLPMVDQVKREPRRCPK